MPLQIGKSNKVIGRNIKELVTSNPGTARTKGIATLAAKRGISPEKAKQKQAIAIAMSKAHKPMMKKMSTSDGYMMAKGK